ncbi:MAG: c-type cytochrome [Brumimicrobium sp.]|nr:c-type cytochrome [Brumimicrobium sp.]
MKKQINYIVFLLSTIIIGIQGFVRAQDGEALFKAKCNTCHIMGKDATGPNLQGVKSKWEGEEDLLIEWVKNSPKVIAEGKSERAKVIKDYSPTVMPIQPVSDQEAKAIVEYVNSWTPSSPDTENPEKVAENVTNVPDYSLNQTLFYVLITVIALLLLSIFIISKSTSEIIKSDKFRNKLLEINKKRNSQGNKLSGLIMILFTGYSFQAAALSAAERETSTEKFSIYVENSDIYVLLTIALLLLGFLLHTVRMFYKILGLIQPKKTPQAVAEERFARNEKRQRTLTKILTAAVPVEEEYKIDTGHEYDGIRELDNRMPPWWLAGFFISIVFAVIYMFHYHVFKTGDLQEVEYAKIVKTENAKVKEYLKAQAMDVDETNATLMTDRADLRAGKSLFINNCAVCHKENGSGEVGPNLTDEYWIYGGDIKDLFGVVKKGTPNGMPDHQSKFNPIEIQQVSSFVLTLDKITQQMGGKEPEGKKYEHVGKTEEKMDDLQRENLKDDSLLQIAK